MVMESLFIMVIHDGQWVMMLKKERHTKYNNDSHTCWIIQNNLFNGWGSLYIIGGEKYEGEWKNGSMEKEPIIILW